MKNWADELVGQARGSVHVVAGLARVSAARGLRSQATGDARHPRGGCFLKRRSL